MSGQNPYMTPLESRKQMLLVESEFNRAQLIEGLQALKDEIQQLKERVEVIDSIASSAVKVADTVSAIGQAFTHRDGSEKKKSSWVSTLFNGARIGASVWGALRSRPK